MRVIEIGCGELPGPYWEGAEDHLLVDNVAANIAEAMTCDPDYRGQVCDAAELYGVDNQSTDLVLARNVFGDWSIGLDQGTIERIILETGGQVEALAASYNPEVEQHKVAIMREAARVLVSSGKLLIVEQYTPHRAAEFITSLGAGTLTLPGELSLPEPVSLRSIAPPSYIAAHRNAQTWLSTRI